MIEWVDTSDYESTYIIHGHKLIVGLEKEQVKNIYWTVHCEGYISYQKIYVKSRAQAKELAIAALTKRLIYRIAHDTSFLQHLTEAEDR